ncbi:MAG: hypothetical protein KC613_02820 [Myxococcales bacterium]|nr:hypothetical protein [Myxococcales bacterium]MCB9525769.1 hypothetical protein [Myxococcales bacterium]
MERDELMDVLLDLKHDLGKHLPRPVRWLPPDASADDLRAALRQALERTHGGRSAAALWADAEGELASVAQRPAFQALALAVQRALAWGARLDDPDAALDRAAVEADLLAVGPAVAALMDAVAHG